MLVIVILAFSSLFPISISISSNYEITLANTSMKEIIKNNVNYNSEMKHLLDMKLISDKIYFLSSYCLDCAINIDENAFMFLIIASKNQFKILNSFYLKLSEAFNKCPSCNSFLNAKFINFEKLAILVSLRNFT